METFKAKTFEIPELKGISPTNIEEHMKLYLGYVKFSNHILSQISEFMKDSEKYAYELGELQRRFAFEFDGMRNHEYYFASFEDGPGELDKDGKLFPALEGRFGSFENFLNQFKSIAMTRGVGWAMLYFDPISGALLTQWVDEQHLGHLTGLCPILCLDMWEHAYVYDYPTSEKKKYIETFFENLNWRVIEQNFKEATGEAQKFK